MHGFQDQTTNQHEGLQVRPRMRVPSDLLQHTLQTQVINAIRRNREVDKDDLYGRALADLTGGDNSAPLAQLPAALDTLIGRSPNSNGTVEHLSWENPNGCRPGNC